LIKTSSKQNRKKKTKKKTRVHWANSPWNQAAIFFAAVMKRSGKIYVPWLFNFFVG
jgi:hypothetical protein